MAATSSIITRPATLDDVAEMCAVRASAFEDSDFNKRAFPPSDPKSDESQVAWIRSILDSSIVVREASSDDGTGAPGRMLGWATWHRREAPYVPPPPFTAAMLPPTGDAEIAVPYFAANRAATIRNSRDQPFWFLTMMAVRRDVQKRGVGTALMRHGVDKADEEGWQALTNATPEGKFLYEKFGFSVVDQTDVADGLVTYHMRREAKPKAT